MSSNAFAFRQNALAFKVKRPCVLLQMHLRFRSNALAFFIREKHILLLPIAGLLGSFGSFSYTKEPYDAFLSGE